jgi:hypothetical protein
MKRFMIVYLIKYYWADQIKKKEMGGACGTCGGEVCAGIWWVA